MRYKKEVLLGRLYKHPLSRGNDDCYLYTLEFVNRFPYNPEVKALVLTSNPRFSEEQMVEYYLVKSLQQYELIEDE